MAKKKIDPAMQESKPPFAAKTPATKEPARGTVGVIGKTEIENAFQILKKYQQGKQTLEARVAENEEWYRQRHWEIVGAGKTEAEQNKAQYDPKPVSAWLFNSLANKHADAMDNYPQPNILPQEERDVEDAKTLSAIIPVIIEKNQFKATYDDAWWYKLKHGTAIYTPIWDSTIDNGLGDITIKGVDILNVFWEPGLKDIQQGKNFFHCKWVDNDALVARYPWLDGMLGGDIGTVTKYSTDDNIDRSNQSEVVDWYYKKQDGSKTILHFCKFVNGQIIYATENDHEPKKAYAVDESTGDQIEIEIPNSSMAEVGLYRHGRYPFEFDVLFPIEGSPCGFGYIDIMKEPQMYIDKMNQIILKNALMAGKKRFFKKKNINLNINDFADWSKDFVDVEGSLGEENLREIQVSPLPQFISNYMEMKIDELKETSGNRDFSQGGTTAGVTAASAIAALQEAGSKLSRDMIQKSYQSYQRVIYDVVELVREFYDEARSFRITGDSGQDEFVQYDNTNIREQIDVDPMTGQEQARMPVFDIKVTAQRQSPFNRIAQNELAKELFSMGLFNPQMADQAMIVLDMMEFEGKDRIVQKVQKNQQLLMMVQKLQNALGVVANEADGMQGGTQNIQAAVADGLIPEEHPLVQQAKANAMTGSDE